VRAFGLAWQEPSRRDTGCCPVREPLALVTVHS